MLTNKYGESVLPKTIPLEEFESILGAVMKYFESRYEAIHSKLDELEAELGAPTAEKQSDSGVKTQSTARTNSGTSDNIQSRSSGRNNSVTSETVSETDKTDLSDKSSDTRSEQNVTIYRKEGEVRRNQELIKTLKEQEAALPNPRFLTTWYKLDTNAVPPVYTLRNIRYVDRKVIIIQYFVTYFTKVSNILNY